MADGMVEQVTAAGAGDRERPGLRQAYRQPQAHEGTARRTAQHVELPVPADPPADHLEDRKGIVENGVVVPQVGQVQRGVQQPRCAGEGADAGAAVGGEKPAGGGGVRGVSQPLEVATARGAVQVGEEEGDAKPSPRTGRGRSPCSRSRRRARGRGRSSGPGRLGRRARSASCSPIRVASRINSEAVASETGSRRKGPVLERGGSRRRSGPGCRRSGGAGRPRSWLRCGRRPD